TRFSRDWSSDVCSSDLYLKFLHQMYGDWSMALAAYNAGPGTLNRAIRRSGGQMTYWAVRDYLPRETQGYVPTFIAVNYIMQYARSEERRVGQEYIPVSV